MRFSLRLADPPVYVFYIIRREFKNLVLIRHEFLTSKEHSSLAQSRTVLLTGIPREYQDVDALTKFATPSSPTISLLDGFEDLNTPLHLSPRFRFPLVLTDDRLILIKFRLPGST